MNDNETRNEFQQLLDESVHRSVADMRAKGWSEAKIELTLFPIREGAPTRRESLLDAFRPVRGKVRTPCEKHLWSRQPAKVFGDGKKVLRCAVCGHRQYFREAANPPHWVILKPGLKEPMAAGWKQRAATTWQARRAASVGIVPLKSGVGVIDHDRGPLDPVLDHLRALKVKPLGVLPTQTEGHHHVLVPVSVNSQVTCLKWAAAEGCAGEFLVDHLVKVYDLPAWEKAIRLRKGRKILFDPNTLPPPPSPPPPRVSSWDTTEPPHPGVDGAPLGPIGRDGPTVPWVSMWHTAEEEVNEGIRNQWLMARATYLSASVPGFVPLRWLVGVNKRLHCDPLPQAELVKMLPGISKWAAWLRRARGSLGLAGEKGREIQRRRGRKSGRVRRQKAEQRGWKTRELRKQGLSVREIAKRLGVGKSTVSRDLASGMAVLSQYRGVEGG